MLKLLIIVLTRYVYKFAYDRLLIILDLSWLVLFKSLLFGQLFQNYFFCTFNKIILFKTIKLQENGQNKLILSFLLSIFEDLHMIV